MIVDHPMFLHAVKVGRMDSYHGPRYTVGPTRTLSLKRNLAKRQRHAVIVERHGSMRAYRREKFQSLSLTGPAHTRIAA
jgi:hypothetical protein